MLLIQVSSLVEASFSLFPQRNNTKTRLQTSLFYFFLHFLRHQNGEADHHNMKFNPNVRKIKNNKEKEKAREVRNILAKKESTILKSALTGISANMLRR